MDSATNTLAPSPTAPATTLNLANVLYETKGAIAYVTVNRPKVLNALSTPTWSDLRRAFEHARDDATVRGVILTGAGAKAFCTARSRETVSWGREVLGGNGIVADYNVARFFADAEALYSYEGTYQMQNLIVGKAITGIGAFV